MSQETCAFCEYFDGGGLSEVQRARRSGEALGGDCLSRQSPRLETTATDTCEHFCPDTGFPEPEKNPAAVALGRRGGKARAKKLTPERRREIARMGAAARHRKTKE